MATTFTLDLTAALVPPLAFATLELNNTPDPIAVMEAVRACTERVDLFCQAGQITVPAQASDLMAFLEPMVHEVRRPRPGHLFHPKLWLLRYTSDDGPAYRLLCLTRNLTQEHSWDVVLRLDGEAGTSPTARNRPLADLVRALPDLAVTPLSDQRRQRLAGLAEDLRRVAWTYPDDVIDVAFHVLGLRGRRTNVAELFAGYRHLVVAPFCTDDGLDLLAPADSAVTVVSRVEDLDRLAPETAARINPYVVSVLAGLDDRDGDRPPAEPGTPQAGVLAGLHAKLYVVERNRRAHVFIGSANATRAAWSGNVEVLVELVGGASKLGVDTFLDDDAPFAALLEPYATAGGAPPDPQEEALRALQDLLRDLAEARFTAAIAPGTDGYTVTVTSDRPLHIPPDYDVRIELMTRPGTACLQEPAALAHAAFAGVPLPDLTPFLILTADSPEGLRRGTVVRATLVGDPAGRLDEVLARQVDTAEKFLRFLALLLGLADPSAALAARDGGGTATGWLTGATGVFELVVRALADRPQAVADLDLLVTRLRSAQAGQHILPDGFTELWDVVLAAHHALPAKVLS